jgi:hypothetical protein
MHARGSGSGVRRWCSDAASSSGTAAQERGVADGGAARPVAAATAVVPRVVHHCDDTTRTADRPAATNATNSNSTTTSTSTTTSMRASHRDDSRRTTASATVHSDTDGSMPARSGTSSAATRRCSSVAVADAPHGRERASLSRRGVTVLRVSTAADGRPSPCRPAVATTAATTDTRHRHAVHASQRRLAPSVLLHVSTSGVVPATALLAVDAATAVRLQLAPPRA